MMSAKIILAVIALAFLAIDNSSCYRQHSNREDIPLLKGDIVLPGTKWCGLGSVANSYDDLGIHRETDKCCREHDMHCEARISPYSYKYGRWNLSWKTASHCQCETRFKGCLLKVNNAASRTVDHLYFNSIKPRCIKFKSGSSRAYFVNLDTALG